MSPRIGGQIIGAHHKETHQDGGADEISIADLSGTPAALTTHAADADAHHPEEVANGRGRYNSTNFVVLPNIYSAIATTTSALTASKLYYFPIIVRTPITIDGVVYEVTVAAGSGEKLYFAIYAADINWQPGARQVVSAELAIDAVAVVNGSLTETTLQEGRYLMAVNCEGNTTFRAARYAGTHVGYIATLGSSFFTAELKVAEAYAEPGATGTAWDTISGSAEPIKYPFWLKVKTP